MHCVICAGRLTPSTAHRLACGHDAFHADCLIEWFRRGNDSCPLCRDDTIAPTHPSSATDRERRLRQYARRKTAPRELVRLVDLIKRHGDATRDAQRAIKSFELTNHNLIQRSRKLYRAAHAARARERIAKSRLSTYTHPDVNVPLLNFRLDAGEESDDDESE